MISRVYDGETDRWLRIRSSLMVMESSITPTTPSPKVSCQFLPRFVIHIQYQRPDWDSLPTGTSLPGGAVLPMSSVADFPMVLPQGRPRLPSLFCQLLLPDYLVNLELEADGLGTKLPGGVMVPIVMQKKNQPKAGDTKDPGPICTIQ